MDKRILVLIVFLLVGFLSAEGSAFAAKEGGIKKVLYNYYEKYYLENGKEDWDKSVLTPNPVGESGDIMIFAMIVPPIPPPGPPGD